MDKKILRLTLVIAVSLFWGTAFTGCSDEEDTPAAYQLKKEDIRVSQPEGGFAVVIDQLLKVQVESESDLLPPTNRLRLRFLMHLSVLWRNISGQLIRLRS